MRSLMKRGKTLLLALLGLAAGATWATTPVAVWDGDFTATQTGFTLNRSGNAISQDNSTITIDQSVGVKVDFTTGLSDAMTVMFKYSDLAFDAQKTLATSFCSGGDENRTGVYAASGGTINGIWNTGDWGNASQTLSKSSGVLAFCYHKSNGTSLYYISADGTRAELFNKSGLKASGDTAINGCTIGGERAKSGATLLSAATGMKITGIAIFDGILTEAEMTGYFWPSEVQTITVNDNTSVSAINAQYDSTTYKAAKVTVASGLTITVDEAFGEKIQSVSSTGSITLSAASQPDASYLANVDFTGVQGGLLRSWLTPGVVGFNFRSANGTDVSGALATADNWIHDNNSASGTSTAMFADGLSTLKWSSANTWACSGSTIISGYLDDGANGGNGATVTLSNVPYETYDVIVYCSSDSNPGQFLAKTVNGTTYTWDSTAGAVVAGNSVWGKAALSTPVYGVNALRIKNLSGPLTIYGTARNGSNRGGIAAIEIMPPNTPDNIRTYTLTLSGAATTWSGGNWTLNDQTVDAPASGYVEIEASASTTLTVDQAVNLADLKISGGENIVVNIATNDTGSLYAIKATVESGVFQQGSPAVLGTTPSIVVASGATFDENGMAINAANAVSIAGAGAGNWPWALTSSSGAGGAILGGLYLSANATIGGANELKVGQTQSGYQCYLQGFTLTKTGAGAFTGTNMNTPGTGTIEVQGGAMSVNQWNNLNSASGDTTVILNSGTSLANGTDRIIPMSVLGLYGGTLSTASKAFKVNTAFRGAGETANLAFGDGASASLTGDLTVTATMTLDGSMTFLKDQEDGSDVVVTPAALTASSGTITVGSGVTFNVGTSRPTATITVAQGGTLAAQLQSASDVIALSMSAQPASIVLYDANGDEVSDPRVSYSDGTLTIMPPVPTLEASGTTVFDTASNWIDSTMPSSNGDAIIQLTGDATITVSGTYTLGSLTITGSGVATFSGNGTITAANISVKNGATFTRNANISATTGISLDAGTVLRLDGVTENAAISGAGAVETYGTVVLAHANTMTGGITVKPGSALSTTAAGGYGEYQSGWVYTAQRQVVVENGGTVDINNVANRDGAVALTIAGKGILSGDVYSGAVTYSGTAAITSGSRQISSLVLTGDALVDVGAGWGLVHSGWGNARLGLNGHTLTVRGTGTFPVVNANNGAATTGTLVLDGATLELSNAASNLAGINVVAKGCATINVATAPSALGSLTLKPSATGTTASNWNLPSGFVPAVDTSNIDADNLTAGQVLTLFTAPSATELTAETIAVKAGGRYTTTISGNTVTATVGDALSNPFLHYDFNNGAAVDTGKASDSRTQIYAFGEHSNPLFVNGRNGQAVHIRTPGCTLYWDTNVSGVSPFVAGEVTVTTVAKLKETGIVLWGLGNTNNSNPAMGLVATNTSVSVVVPSNSSTFETILTLDGTSDLTTGWHFIAVVANANGTTLYVDGLSATTDKTVSFAIGQQGQFGSFHGGAIGGRKVGSDGYYLDDWRVYDATLTAAEVASLRSALTYVTVTVPSVENATVVVTANGTPVEGDNGVYTVNYGSAVVATYTAAAGYRLPDGVQSVYNVTADADKSVVVSEDLVPELLVASITVGDVTTTYTSLQAAVDAVAQNKDIVLLVTEEDGATVSREVTFSVVPGEYTYGDIVAFGNFVLTTTNLETKTRYSFAPAVIAVTINDVRTLYSMMTANTGIETANAGPIGTTIEVLSGNPADYVQYLPMFDLADGVFTKVANPVAAVYQGVIQQQVYRSLADAIEAAKAGQTVKLLADDRVSFADVTVEERIPSGGSIVINKNLTINGAGFTVYGNTNAEILNATGAAAPGYDMVADLVDGSNLLGFFVKSGNVTFTNITLTEFGDTAYVNKFGYTPIQTASAYTGTLTLTNVNFNKFNRTAVCVRGGTLSMTGGIIAGGTVNKNNGDYFQQPVEVRGGTATISGVEITGGNDIAGNGGGAIVAWATTTITNVDIDFTGYGVWSDGPVVAITGENTSIKATVNALFAEEDGTITVEAGDFTGALAVDSDPNSGISLTGGTFSVDPTDYVASGYKATESAGVWTVSEKSGIDPASDTPSVPSTAANPTDAVIEAKANIVAPTGVDKAIYAEYFKYEVTGTSGNYVVAITGFDDDLVEDTDDVALDALQAAVADSEATVFTVAVPAGLYYKIETFDTLGGTAVDFATGLSNGTTEAVDKPTGTTQGFIKVQISTKAIN